ncbi:MAG: UDP-3-O-(3-hydroxymyristoyl)glucosamine N-acyltransferase [Alphaproteobacteria bacterium]|nr:UDP-3-O-(3-hydroxymyristoyl)glucosamine N-acyltransferase [Alphaproteobacteria bacterium]
MPDHNFFKVAGPFSLRQLAEITQSEIGKNSDPNKMIYDVGSLKDGDEKSVSFLLSKKYIEDLKKSRVGAVIVAEEFVNDVPEDVAVLIAKEPYKSYGLVAQAFYPKEKSTQTVIHEKSSIAVTAQIGVGCIIDACAVIGEHVKIGDYCHICANAVISDNVEIGNNCTIGMNASIQYCKMGNDVYIYPGARIGQDGFGFFMSPKGHTKIPQLGRVIIGNDVEIGANTCIDRGALDDTIIGDGCRLDNLIQFGHNVQTGRCCVVVAQAGVAGSSHLGDFVVLAGQSGVGGHLNIGSGAQIAAQSGILKDVQPMEKLMGTPAVPLREFMRQAAILNKMAKK